jgi:hypothetical protein
MKKIKHIHWTVTGLMAALMLLATIPDLLQADNAIAVFMHLGYPRYLLPFLGTAKGLAIVGVLIPRFPRLKEWVYAGLSIDVGGALYSHLSVKDGPSGWMPALIALILVGSSYLTYRLQSSAELTQGIRGGEHSELRPNALLT